MRRSMMVLTGLLVATGAVADETVAQEVLGAVNVAGVDVGGLTAAEARQRLGRELQDKLATVLRVTDGKVTAERTRAELGIGLDLDAMLERAKAGDAWVPLRLEVDRVTFQRVLRGLAPRFQFAGRDAKPYEWRGAFHILPGLYRREMNVGRTAQVWADRIEADPATLRLNVMFEKSPPNVRSEDLKGIDGRLSQFATRFNSGNVPRTTNLRLAIAAIDGRILKPGEVFSLNDTVGERTPERGYQKAKIFVDRRIEEGYGGGVSQVTGTLFNAALLAGLDIVTYTTHSRPVDYLPIGRDATVAWGLFDMKFKNSTPSPLYIRYAVEGSRAVATLYGATQPGITYHPQVVSKTLGPRHITASLYRVVKRDGEVSDKSLIGTSEYRWEPDTPPEGAEPAAANR